jgi:hypothetical protein
MSLAEVNLLQRDPIALFDVKAAIRRWEKTSPSLISHHGRRCCALAREWFFATDLAQLNSESRLTGPRWVRQRFTWGPSPWPIAWCEIANRKILDCGALAALTHEIFLTRGVRSFRGQLIQEFSPEATSQWLNKWTADGTSVHWITPGLIYHEVCAVEMAPRVIRLWDPSAGWWADTRRVQGYGAVRALRICVESAETDAGNLRFEHHTVAANRWQELRPLTAARRRDSDAACLVVPPPTSANIPQFGGPDQ